MNVRLRFTFLSLLLMSVNLGCESTSKSTGQLAAKSTAGEAAMFRNALTKAERGDALAQCQVGQYYAAGQGCEQNLVQAVVWYQKAADQGNSAAQTRLGICYDEGNGIDYNATESVKWLRKAAVNGDSEAQVYLAHALLNGSFLDNFPEAIQWLSQAAKQGNADAQGDLLTFTWIRAMEQESTNGPGWKDLRAAADKGNREAAFGVGSAYFRGYGVARNEAESLRWFLLAAEQREVRAESAVAWAFFNGCGTNKNVRQAVKWVRQAGEQGDFRAQNMMGRCYLNGTGISRNYSEAIKWFRKSAARGSDEAQTSLGLAYRDGKLVRRDYVQAYHWLDLAALQGNTNAITARNDLFRQMSPEQRASAGAVSRPRLDTYDSAFTQSAGSCTLSGYAIVANHFTGLPVTAYFEGYCHHFGIAYTNALDAEVKYSCHFDTETLRRKCLGCEVLLDLHSNATEQCFVEARNRFDVQLFRESVPHVKEIEQALHDRDATLMIGVGLGFDVHTVTVFDEGPQFFLRDPARKGFHAISGLQDIGKLLDAVLCVAKQ
jgi:TPR repeat protein